MSHITKKALKKRRVNNLHRVWFDIPLGQKDMGKPKRQLLADAAKRELRDAC